MECVVIYHPKFGVYLGSALGLGFWSELDPVGQTGAVTFPNEAAAKSCIDKWENRPIGELEIVTVFASDTTAGVRYATPEDCRRAGLPQWDPNSSPLGQQ